MTRYVPAALALIASLTIVMLNLMVWFSVIGIAWSDVFVEIFLAAMFSLITALVAFVFFAAFFGKETFL